MLQAGDLIDQVDRERGANRNLSRGIQFIHAKRLAHHPNTRYTLLVMDSWYNVMTSFEVYTNQKTVQGLFLKICSKHHCLKQCIVGIFHFFKISSFYCSFPPTRAVSSVDNMPE